MRRREFITLLGGATLAWPLAARAQQAKGVRRLAVLFGSSTEVSAPFLAAVRKRLSESGWVEGRNLHIDVRWGEGDVDRLRTFAAELVGLAPDAILAQSTPALDALRQRTDKIPLIFHRFPIQCAAASSRIWRAPRATLPASPISSTK
jgi:putative tryptophan/tyrosine transport system substrate-binding protein